MDSFTQQRIGQNTRGGADYQPPTWNFPSSQSQPRRPSWLRFSIPTSAVSLSSGFDYDFRLQQLFVNPSEWKEFTNDIIDAAKLSFGDNKKAWGAGLATGTAGTFALLFLGPIAGYYAGKAVHKRMVVQKVRERLLEDGKISNVLRRWNEGAWAKRGFHTSLEFPEEDGNVNRADAERFRIVIIPGSIVITQFPMSSQIDTPVEMELQGEQLFQRPEVSQQRATQQLRPHHQPSPISQISSPGFQPQFQNSTTPQPYPQEIQQQQQPVQIPSTQQYSKPPLPARVSSIQNLPGNPIYEMPNTRMPTVSELPSTQAGPGESVHYYEMAGESVRR